MNQVPITCASCRKPYVMDGIHLITAYGRAWGSCKECWEQMSVVERQMLQNDIIRTLGAHDQTEAIKRVAVEINLFRDFIETICNEAREQNGDDGPGWLFPRRN